VLVATTTAKVDGTVNRMWRIHRSTGLGLLAILAVAGWFAVRSGLRPLSRIEQTAADALRAGASGFLLKHARFPGQTPAQQQKLSALTEREREVLAAIASGFSNAEIAERLSVAETTVKSHVSRILMKIDIRDRVQAVIFAYGTGQVRPA